MRRKEKRYLNPEQIRYYKTEIKELEDEIRKRQNSPVPRVRATGIAHLHQRLAKYKKILETLTAKKPPSVKQNKILEEYKELTERIKEGLPTYDEMQQSKSVSPAYCVRKDLAWREKFERTGLVKHWRNLARQLDKDNPTLGDVELLRKQH